jgi:hypothetical protein
LGKTGASNRLAASAVAMPHATDGKFLACPEDRTAKTFYLQTQLRDRPLAGRRFACLTRPFSAPFHGWIANHAGQPGVMGCNAISRLPGAWAKL